MRNDLGEWRVARERFPAKQAAYRPRDGDVLAVGGGEDLFQRGVVFRPKKGEGCGQRAGRHASDEVELRPRAGGSPTTKNPSPKGAVAAAA